MNAAGAIDWDFSNLLGMQRLCNLRAPPSFESIVTTLRSEMHVICMHPEPCDIAQGFERIIYCLKIPCAHFDLFFNSRTGYRAAHFVSPYEGLRANCEVLTTLAPALIASGATGKQRSHQFIEQSLRSPSAKIWLAEPERGFCSGCDGEWSNPEDEDAEIFNGRWDTTIHENAVKGRKAPYFSKLRVFGAFLNHRFDEVVPERKRHRAQHLHDWGWA